MREWIMYRLLIVGITSLCLSFAALAEDVTPSDPSIKSVIQSQIDAFQRDDFAEAFTFASPNIQRIFGSSERFGQMVRNGYPMVWRPADVQFLESRSIGGRLWQKVLIEDGNGALHVLDYQMVETVDGWLINGVQLLEAPRVGV